MSRIRVRCWRASILVLLAALSVLSVHASVCGPILLHIDKLNDQVGYITTARWLADTGELRSQLIYPASFGERWRIYMPGHYWMLAGSYLLLGDRPLAWRLPSLVGFATTTVCLFLAGHRLYGARTGALAAALFAVFPANIFYAFTAMSELAGIAVSVLSFCVFVHLKRPLRWMPLLLVPPFLFKEAGAFLIFPMLAVVISREFKARAVVAAAAVSVAMLALVYAWQAADGRQGMPLSWQLLGDFGRNRADATLEKLALDGRLLALIVTNFIGNVEMLTSRLFLEFARSWEPAISAAQLMLLLSSFAWGYRRAPSDAYPIGAGLLALSVLFLVTVLHTVKPHVFYRHMLFGVPFTALAVAPFLLAVGRRLAEAIGSQARRLALFASLAVAALATSHSLVLAMARDLVLLEAPPQTRRLEEIGHDDRSLLVGPPILLDYVRKHYPVRWSFEPANEETLRRLADHYEIGTLVQHRRRGLDPSVLAKVGLYPAGAFVGRYDLFKPSRGSQPRTGSPARERTQDRP